MITTGPDLSPRWVAPVIEPGRRYRRADGSERRPMRPNLVHDTLFRWVDHEGATYTDAGQFTALPGHPNNLVSALPTNAETPIDRMTLADLRRGIEAAGLLR